MATSGPAAVARAGGLIVAAGMGAALAGGLVGTTLGIRLPVTLVLRSLALVLVVAGAKLMGVY